MTEPHLHNKIGDAIRDCKQRLFKRLKGGADVDSAIVTFLRELEQALREIVSKT